MKNVFLLILFTILAVHFKSGDIIRFQAETSVFRLSNNQCYVALEKANGNTLTMINCGSITRIVREEDK